MKNKIIAIFIFLLPFVAYSQEFNGGFYAGFVSSQLDGDKYTGYNKTGMLLGVFVNRKLTNKYGAQMELRFIQKGSREDDTKKGGTTYYKSKLNYIEIPFLAQYFVKKFTFEGGLAAAYLFSSKEEDYYGEIPDEQRIAFEKFEISSILGFSYSVFENLKADFRFQYSVLPVRKNVSDEVYTPYISNKYSFNNLLTFTILYQF